MEGQRARQNVTSQHTMPACLPPPFLLLWDDDMGTASD
jgi:hypothetical protein